LVSRLIAPAKPDSQRRLAKLFNETIVNTDAVPKPGSERSREIA
jgi:hypothetical protein